MTSRIETATKKDRPKAGAPAARLRAADGNMVRSTFHAHTADSACLEAVAEVPNSLGNLPPPTMAKREHLVTAVGPGWYRCKVTKLIVTGEPYWLHDHGGGRFVSHFPNKGDGRLAGCVR